MCKSDDKFKRQICSRLEKERRQSHVISSKYCFLQPTSGLFRGRIFFWLSLKTFCCLNNFALILEVIAYLCLFKSNLGLRPLNISGQLHFKAELVASSSIEETNWNLTFLSTSYTKNFAK